MEKIYNNLIMKQVLKDSFGGVLYNVDNRNKYNKVEVLELLELWDNLPNTEKELATGDIKGAINFLKK